MHTRYIYTCTQIHMHTDTHAQHTDTHAQHTDTHAQIHMHTDTCISFGIIKNTL